jgi:pyruvate/2-oxoglutarate/acetoin dehydrogenase E1 component
VSERDLLGSHAINEALYEEMRRDPNVFIMGEDVRAAIFGVTRGLYDEFGEERVRDTPISECAIVSSALGAAIMGRRPVVEINPGDFIVCAMDEIVNHVAKYRYMMGHHTHLVIRVAFAGAGVGGAGQHSQSLEAYFVHTPGLRVVFPSTPYDLKGLLKTAIRGEDPVIFFEHKLITLAVKGLVPKEEYAIPFGVADIKKAGRDVTIVTYGYPVHAALTAAAKLEKDGISVEVVDPRTLNPLDKKTIFDSVKKTRRLVIVHEACKTGGVGAEIAALVAEEAFDYLDAPIMRVCAADTVIPFSKPLEQYVLPDENKILKAVREITGRS